jgi:hypothetical protein
MNVITPEQNVFVNPEIGDLIVFPDGQALIIGEEDNTGLLCAYDLEGQGVINGEDFKTIENATLYKKNEYELILTKKDPH